MTAKQQKQLAEKIYEEYNASEYGEQQWELARNIRDRDDDEHNDGGDPVDFLLDDMIRIYVNDEVHGKVADLTPTFCISDVEFEKEVGKNKTSVRSYLYEMIDGGLN